MKAKTQKEAVKNHLINYGHITPHDALIEYGCFRLSHIIYLLRNEMQIETLSTKSISKFGNAVSYATYKLKENDKN